MQRISNSPIILCHSSTTTCMTSISRPGRSLAKTFQLQAHGAVHKDAAGVILSHYPVSLLYHHMHDPSFKAWSQPSKCYLMQALQLELAVHKISRIPYAI